MMKYSVLMTVYKKDDPKFFDEALKSMIKQTSKPDEIILVKDGPIGEELQTIINSNKKDYRKIVEISLKENKGLGLALNEGLKACKNELVARMDADDISEPDRCKKQLRCFEENNNLAIVGCPVKEFSGEKENIVGYRDVPLTNVEIHKYAKRRDPFNHPTVMYKKSKVLEVGGYGNYRKNQDTDLWIKMLHNNCEAKNIDKYLLYFRFDEKTYKKRKSWINTKLLIKIRWNGYKIGFSSLLDFILVACAQFSMFISPIWFQKILYERLLRKNG